jgi:hypothetical protein
LAVESGDIVSRPFHVGRTTRPRESSVDENARAGARGAQGYWQKVVRSLGQGRAGS